jgi:hypothetical protein
MQQKRPVKIKDDAHIFIHNDLDNAAHFLKGKIEERIKKGDRDGIGLEIMACLVMIAFAFEARSNFLGVKVFDRWDERQPHLKKVKRIANKLDEQINWTARPYLTVKELKEFRDTLAHGKPLEIQGEKNIVLTDEEIKKRNILKADWQNYTNEDFLKRSYEDTETIWKALLAAAGLNIMDTLTSGDSTVEIIEQA